MKDRSHRSVGLFTLAFLLARMGSGQAMPANPYSQKKPLAIKSWKVLSPLAPRRYDEVEIGIELTATYGNPFDSSDIALDAEFVAPSGKRISLPGFLYQPFERRLSKATLPIAYPSTEAVKSGKAATTQTYDQAEILKPSGSTQWRLRFCPVESGTYQGTLILRTRQGQARKGGLRLVVSAKHASEGFVRVSKADSRFLGFDSGKPYFPIGSNLCWAGEKGTFQFDEWIPRYGKAGANWIRLWLSPHWTTCALERPDSGDGRLGFRHIDLANAWRLDHIMRVAEKNGLRVQICIDSYNVLRDRVSWPSWDDSPYNKANGGPLEKPENFWNSTPAQQAYRDKLRYLVARYGSSTAVEGWEFWNEVDGVSAYSVGPVLEWHARTAAFLHKIDPYGHLVLTSYGGDGHMSGDKEVFAAPGIDISQSHIYERPDLAEAVAEEHRRLGGLRKPHFMAEMGADVSGPRATDDPEGWQLHDPMWVAIASGEAGGEMLWWWDSYIQPQGLYRLYSPVSRFVADIDWPHEAFRSVEPRFLGARPPLVAWAIAGRTAAIAWVRQKDRTWKALATQKLRTEPTTACQFVLPGLQPGRWRVELWDTWGKDVVAKAQLSVPTSGNAVIDLPAISKDLALKLRRIR